MQNARIIKHPLPLKAAMINVLLYNIDTELSAVNMYYHLEIFSFIPQLQLGLLMQKSSSKKRRIS